jgi:hypothetical protein
MIPLAAPLISRELGAHMTRRQCPHFTITSLQDYDILLGFINESSHLPFKNKKRSFNSSIETKRSCNCYLKLSILPDQKDKTFFLKKGKG